MTRFFWDSNLFVYLIEEHPIYCPQVTCLRKYIRQQGDVLATSVLTYGEILVYPYKKQDPVLIQAYQQIFCHSDILLLPFSLSIAEIFAQIRAQHKVKPADAFQLACAASQGTHYFVTNDLTLTSLNIDGIDQIIRLDDVLAELGFETA